MPLWRAKGKDGGKMAFKREDARKPKLPGMYYEKEFVLTVYNHRISGLREGKMFFE